MTGPELRIWRIRRGLTQVEAARLLDTSYRSYRRFEAGQIPRWVPLKIELLTSKNDGCTLT